MDMKRFILIHEHKHGVSHVEFTANSTIAGLQKNVHSVCEMLGVDFEEDKEESITFDEGKETKDLPNIVL